jgi:putative peptidoglycan lipid II flippase
MVPAIIAGGILQINLLVDTIFASLLTTGSPTWLYVSDRLIQFPMGIFAIAIGTVLLPELSKLSSDQDKTKFIDRVKKGQRFVLFIGIPSFIGLAFCSVDLISTIFLRGEFGVGDVYQSSFSLIAFSFGLPFFMLMKVLTPTFFARKDTKTPMYIALISLMTNACLNYILAFTFGFGHIGIAIGSSISAIISVLILEIILIKQGIVVLHNPVNRFNLSVLVSSIFMIVFLHSSSSYSFIDLNSFERVLFLLFKVLISITIYFSFARLIYGKPLKEILD